MSGASCEAVLFGCPLAPRLLLPLILSGLCLAGDRHLFLLSVGGPAEKAGLQQLDTVLQLNEQPVEHWKCVELAHEIR